MLKKRNGANNDDKKISPQSTKDIHKLQVKLRTFSVPAAPRGSIKICTIMFKKVTIPLARLGNTLQSNLFRIRTVTLSKHHIRLAMKNRGDYSNEKIFHVANLFYCFENTFRSSIPARSRKRLLRKFCHTIVSRVHLK